MSGALFNQERWDDLLFGIQRSIRYHGRREAFFSNLHRVTAFVSILLGSAAFFILSRDWDERFLMAVAAAVTILNAFDLVVGFSSSARRHAELRRRFSTVQACMMGTPGAQQYEKCWKDRLEIEADEPPTMLALNILCHNELKVAQEGSPDADPENYYHVPYWRAWMANLLRQETWTPASRADRATRR